ncbi:MAG: hypothetical protein L7S42_03735 [Flavobacteriaceae bacterium]|nr:hypothetical protein [Flavobacteriaceae bacterium]
MKTWLLFFLTLFPVTSQQPLDHKFYLSVTQMEFDADKNRITAISRVFVDDLEETLRQRYDVQLALGTDREDEKASFYIRRYMEQKLTVEINNVPLKFSFAGFTYQNDQIVLLSEFSIIDSDEYEIKVTNTLITDAYSEQQNLVHFRMNQKKQSEVLTKERPFFVVAL